MSALELSGLILAGEFALLAWGILFFLLLRQRRRSQVEQVHAEDMMQDLATHEVSRRDALAALFENTYKLEGEELTAKVDEYVEREKAFYNAMLGIYLDRDGGRLKQIPAELTKVLAPWVQMTPSGMVDAKEMGTLEDEKTALAVELESTKATLEELMDEYMAAFKEAQPSSDDAPGPAEQEQTNSVADIVFEDEAQDTGPSDAQEQPPIAESPVDAKGVEPMEREARGRAPAGPFELGEEAPAALDEPAAAGVQTRADAESGQGSDREGGDEQMANQELEGLADLFDPPSDKA